MVFRTGSNYRYNMLTIIEVGSPKMFLLPAQTVQFVT